MTNTATKYADIDAIQEQINTLTLQSAALTAAGQTTKAAATDAAIVVQKALITDTSAVASADDTVALRQASDGTFREAKLGTIISAAVGAAASTSGTLAQFAATTSLELKGVISDETGSGALVFANGPTLIAPVLGTPASGVATNLTGTAAGLTAGDATKVANTTPTATGLSILAAADAAAVRTAAASAPLASPTFTGVPAAPTAAPGANSTQLATTAYSDAAGVVLAAATALKANTASPTLTGVPAAPTPISGTNSTQIATTAFVQGELSLAVSGLLSLKGDQSASGNPNYLAGTKGDAYYITVAGIMGGASGKTVAAGDLLICKTTNAGGDEAAVGTSWFVLEKNLVGALLAANNLSDLGNAGTALSNLGFSAFGKTIIDDADGAAVQTTLGISAFAQTILDDANAATVRATVGAAASAGTVLSSTLGLTGIEDTITAHAGGTQAAAFALDATKTHHHITVCATAADSVRLPALVVGEVHFLHNSGATSCKVFGAGTDTINDIATATGVNLIPGTGALFHAVASGKWYALGLSQSVFGINNGNVTAPIAQVADSTTTGGNARGANSIDLQRARTANTQVASATGSVCLSGKNGTASAGQAAVLGGDTPTASGVNSAVIGGDTRTASGGSAVSIGGTGGTAGGTDAVAIGGTSPSASGNQSATIAGASLFAGAVNSVTVGGASTSVLAGATGACSLAMSNGQVAATGLNAALIAGKYGQARMDSQVVFGAVPATGTVLGSYQASRTNIVARTTDNTQTELKTNATRLIMVPDQAWAFTAKILGRRTDVDGENSFWELKGLIIQNTNAASTAIIGSLTSTLIAQDAAASAWAVTAVADTTNGALVFKVTGENAKTIAWIGTVELSELLG